MVYALIARLTGTPHSPWGAAQPSFVPAMRESSLTEVLQAAPLMVESRAASDITNIQNALIEYQHCRATGALAVTMP